MDERDGEPCRFLQNKSQQINIVVRIEAEGFYLVLFKYFNRPVGGSNIDCYKIDNLLIVLLRPEAVDRILDLTRIIERNHRDGNFVGNQRIYEFAVVLHRSQAIFDTMETCLRNLPVYHFLAKLHKFFAIPNLQQARLIGVPQKVVVLMETAGFNGAIRFYVNGPERRKTERARIGAVEIPAHLGIRHFLGR